MKKFWLVFFLVAIGFGIYFFRNRNAATPPAPASNGMVSENNSRAPAATDNAGNGAATSAANPGAKAASPGDLAARAASPNWPTTNPIPVLPPLTVLDNARVVIHNYNSAFGENPVGTNPEITAALTGHNPKQITFITAESGLRLDGNGELVDGWGTPFFFHQLSGKEMEIRSAGEDRQLWTLDDQVTR